MVVVSSQCWDAGFATELTSCWRGPGSHNIQPTNPWQNSVFSMKTVIKQGAVESPTLFAMVAKLVFKRPQPATTSEGRVIHGRWDPLGHRRKYTGERRAGCGRGAEGVGVGAQRGEMPVVQKSTHLSFRHKDKNIHTTQDA